jgi:hypothetical protein
MKKFHPQKMQEDEWEAYLLLDEQHDIGGWLEEKKRTITVEIDQEIVSIMGVLPLPNGGGHLWLFLSGDVKGAGLRIVTKCVEGALQGLKEVGYEWVQTPVKAGFKQGKRWAKLLGFTETEEEEDLMENGIMYTYWTRVL